MHIAANHTGASYAALRQCISRHTLVLSALADVSRLLRRLLNIGAAIYVPSSPWADMMLPNAAFFLHKSFDA